MGLEVVYYGTRSLPYGFYHRSRQQHQRSSGRLSASHRYRDRLFRNNDHDQYDGHAGLRLGRAWLKRPRWRERHPLYWLYLCASLPSNPKYRWLDHGFIGATGRRQYARSKFPDRPDQWRPVRNHHRGRQGSRTEFELHRNGLHHHPEQQRPIHLVANRRHSFRHLRRRRDHRA